MQTIDRAWDLKVREMKKTKEFDKEVKSFRKTRKVTLTKLKEILLSGEVSLGEFVSGWGSNLPLEIKTVYRDYLVSTSGLLRYTKPSQEWDLKKVVEIELTKLIEQIAENPMDTAARFENESEGGS